MFLSEFHKCNLLCLWFALKFINKIFSQLTVAFGSYRLVFEKCRLHSRTFDLMLLNTERMHWSFLLLVHPYQLSKKFQVELQTRNLLWSSPRCVIESSSSNKSVDN